jgi:sec-independent protein translocase protein TatA|tara:strand:+ start:10204 stop:10401 length:198 start_codon:yes stop_codon:yes gene_type:complete
MILSVLPLAIGWPQIVIILVVAFIIFGPVGIGKKLGNLIKGTGKGVKEFKKALNEDEKEEEESEE